MAQSVEDVLVVRLEASLRKFENQMASARKAAETNSTAMERRFGSSTRNMQADANATSANILKMGNLGGSGRFVLQNTANQIGDIAVQLGSGTSASRALGQQMPQLLGGFGALGGTLGLVAPLLGTVAAIGLPLSVALLKSGEAAQSLDDKMKSLRESISAVKAAQELIPSSTYELVEQYGGLADRAAEFFEINRQIASIRATSALDVAARGVADELGVEGVFGFGPDEVRELDQTLVDLRQKLSDLQGAPASTLSDSEFRKALDEIAALDERIGDLDKVQDNIDDLADTLGITAREAREVAAQFAAVGQARGPQEQARVLLDLADYIYEATQNLTTAEEEGKNFYDRLKDAAIQALNLAQVDLAGSVTDAANEAGRLADNLARARGARIDELAGGNVDFSDPRGREFGSATAGVVLRDRGVPKENKPDYTPPKTRSGGGASVSPGLREAQRLYDQTRTSAEQYAIELERINELHRMFPEIITEDVRDRAVQALDDSTRQLNDTTRTLEASLSNMFSSIVTGSASARDALSSLLGTMAQLFAQKAFTSLFGELNIPFFASGTAFHHGGPAIVGERGPELVNLPRGAQVLSAERSRSLMSRGGGGAMAISVTVNGARGNSEIQDMVFAGVRQGLEQYDRSILPRSIRRAGRDPRRVS